MSKQNPGGWPENRHRHVGGSVPKSQLGLLEEVREKVRAVEVTLDGTHIRAVSFNSAEAIVGSTVFNRIVRHPIHGQQPKPGFLYPYNVVDAVFSRVRCQKTASKIGTARKRALEKWKDDPRCHYCDAILKFEEVTADHIKPKSKGGRHNLENIVCSCAQCNVRKGHKSYELFVRIMLEKYNVKPYAERRAAPATSPGMNDGT